MEDIRQTKLSQWLMTTFSLDKCNLKSMNGDAGFRRYFRFIMNNQSFIAVDSPGDKCNNDGFIAIQQMLAKANIFVPTIEAYDKENGFFCLSDLGDNLLGDVLTEQNMGDHYRKAIALLPTFVAIPPRDLPIYDDKFIQTELNIFSEWLLNTHLDIYLSSKESQQLQSCFDFLIESAVSQPQVFMHRDFHSRNLLLVNDHLATIDFQDAVIGPITYDIVSLLRDCYVKWPIEQVMSLFDEFISLIVTADHFEHQYDKQQWLYWFDLMGLQRHIKASGIFARLFHRDGKSSYLTDIPLTLSYIVDVSANYQELAYLNHLVKNIILPKLSMNLKEEN